MKYLTEFISIYLKYTLNSNLNSLCFIRNKNKIYLLLFFGFIYNHDI